MASNSSPVVRKRVTLKDIARELDISHATVSRALNDAEDPFISEATRERVRLVAAQLGYRPNNAARNLATGRTGLLALLLWCEEEPGSYHSIVARHFHVEALRRRYQLVTDYLGPETLTVDPQNQFDFWNVDGIIAHEASPFIERQFPKGSRPPTPIVSTGVYQWLEGADHVEVDLWKGAQDAMAHLLDQGAKRIAYLSHALKVRGVDPRDVAYTQAMASAGLKTEYIETDSTRANTRIRIREYVADQGAPDAILCHNDDLAIGAYRGLCDLKIRVPEQTAIIGCDGTEDCEYFEVPLSSIVQPLTEMCTIAAQFLEKRIAEPSHPLQKMRIESRLVIRESSLFSKYR